MPRTPFGARAQLETLAQPIVAAAELASAAVRKARRQRNRTLNGVTLHPGVQTPLWNKLAADVAKTLRRRGDKAQLARILGVSRQRLHLLVVAKAACPDAERTLLLQQWLNARRSGENLA